MSKTRIVIIRLKEIIYTAIFVGLGILLILLLVFMFWPKKKNVAFNETDKIYTAGIYTTQLMLNDTAINLEVVVDDNHVNSVSLVNIDDSVTTMYPLIAPAIEDISKQLSKGIEPEMVNLSEDSKYTQILLLKSITETLNLAKITE